MKKTIFLFGVVVLILPLLLAGCGIAQSEYDAVVAERDAAKNELNAAQSQIATLQGDYAAAQSEIEKLEGDYAAAQSEIGTLQGQLSKAQGDYDTVKQKVDKAKLYGEILDWWLFVPYFEATTAQVLELSSMVDDTGNAELKEKWATYLDSGTDEDMWEFYFALWDGLWEALA